MLSAMIEDANLSLLKIAHVLKSLSGQRLVQVSLLEALKDADASLIFRNGIIVGIMIGRDSRRTISSEQFSDMAAEYETTVAINEILSS